jgi:hypothetical protein
MESNHQTAIATMREEFMVRALTMIIYVSLSCLQNLILKANREKYVDGKWR